MEENCLKEKMENVLHNNDYDHFFEKNLRKIVNFVWSSWVVGRKDLLYESKHKDRFAIILMIHRKDWGYPFIGFQFFVWVRGRGLYELTNEVRCASSDYIKTDLKINNFDKKSISISYKMELGGKGKAGKGEKEREGECWEIKGKAKKTWEEFSDFEIETWNTLDELKSCMKKIAEEVAIEEVIIENNMATWIMCELLDSDRCFGNWHQGVRGDKLRYTLWRKKKGEVADLIHSDEAWFNDEKRRHLGTYDSSKIIPGEDPSISRLKMKGNKITVKNRNRLVNFSS